MPQFDTFSFFSQISWTFFFFCLIFLVNSYSLFPLVAVVLKTRAVKSWQQTSISDQGPEASVKLLFYAFPIWSGLSRKSFFTSKK